MTDSKHDGARKVGPALEGTYQFVLWLIPTVEKFPRSQKFLLGDRIQSTALNVLENGVRSCIATFRHLVDTMPRR